jgi:hypothetical protein
MQEKKFSINERLMTDEHASSVESSSAHAQHTISYYRKEHGTRLTDKTIFVSAYISLAIHMFTLYDQQY